MAEEIQNLIEMVLAEQIQTRDAKLKHLQAQINPHFLYNCLGFIINMTKLNKKEAVLAMSHNLSDYYRYTIRLGDDMVTIEDEILLVKNYLEILNLRSFPIELTCHIPDDLMELSIPRLLLQPLIENSCIHGIEPLDQTGKIEIRCVETEGVLKISVGDNGVGLTDQKIGELKIMINQPQKLVTNYGIWNVYHRLLFTYGETAKLELSHSNLGGLQVALSFELNGDKIADRGKVS
jgi:two-component system, sensor histidine kinase YesM